ncbi:MAG: penicillin-binding protein 2 [Candidatus Marinimicrobia bacterium]|jgi:penicillin-binding protein 2|nr:penicillin-binding protein 2 [Candidatus Neomarinimicrobiota bacterium]MDD4961774.1 penicillin-binding protein 2 [Candidatus Neomarinimicrobiota bacterium]MDD5709250.1 penicillin-binding protein 2 [Candidatus Neomarinimicrobiota bacterium]MDX9777359.1 penicillin-binding protein 2 [bacterium]
MFKEPQNHINKYRLLAISTVAVLLFCILIIRFFDLQIIQHAVFKSQAMGNMLNRTDISAPRGLVYDRDGRKLIYNIPSYNLVVYPDLIRQHPETWQKLANMCGIPVASLQENMKRSQIGAYRPAVVLRNINFKINTCINENILDLPGAEVAFDPVREYLNEIKSGNILGYTAPIRPQDYYLYRQQGYKPGDFVGYDGIEKQYEHLLKGERGYRYKQVNAVGKPLNDQAYEQINPKPGDALYLTIDSRLQAEAEVLMQKYNGAAVLMNYENGEILAAVSSPGYDPDLFNEGLTQAQWDSVSQDKRIPLFNRMIRGQYPAGSIYKMIAAIAGLEKGVITPETQYECTGIYALGGREYRCSHVHGMENLNEAIAHSCNIYFYNVILELGVDDWCYFQKKLGFGELTGIDLPGELPGIAPDRDFLDRQYGRRKWWKGTWLNMVIGQGDVLITPIQAVRYAAILATRGKVPTPHLLRAVHSTETNSLEYPEYPLRKIDGISDNTWKEIESGMLNAVQSNWGTGRTANVPGLNLFGKTGTAQNPHGEAHAWFVGYSKLKDFPYAVAVFVEHGMGGSDTAAPIAGKLLKAWYYMRRS